jgi:hypothetical protein
MGGLVTARPDHNNAGVQAVCMNKPCQMAQLYRQTGTQQPLLDRGLNTVCNAGRFTALPFAAVTVPAAVV